MSKLTDKQIDELRAVIANFDGLQSEMVAAAKRKAGEPVTPFQLKVINGAIARANTILKDDRPVAEFTEFDLDDIPTVSDVSMIVAQYVEAFEKLRCAHISKMYDGSWVWAGSHHIHTVPPRARK